MKQKHIQILSIIIMLILLSLTTFILGMMYEAEKTNTIVLTLNKNINKTNYNFNTFKDFLINHSYDKCPEIPDIPDFECKNEYKTINTWNPNIFQKMADDVAGDYDYEIDVWDCTEFAEELVRRLKTKGWRATEKYTQVNCNSDMFEKESCEIYNGGHRIVRVNDIYIEATTGNIIQPEDYEVYGLR